MTDRTLHDPELGRLLEPTDARLERIRERLAAATTGYDATPIAPIRRRRPVRVASILVAAAAIALLVALSPSIDPPDGSTAAERPTTASAALLAAAEAAGAAEWRPLAPDEYHHVYSTTFAPPELAPVAGMDDRQMAWFSEPWPSATESFLRPDGRGVQVQITGGEAGVFPILTPDSNGELSGYSLRGTPKEPVDVEEALEHANVVRTWRWRPGDERQTDTIYFRTPTGYRRGVTWSGEGYPVPGVSTTARAQVRYWGDTYEAISRLDDLTGEQLDAAVLELLDGDPRDRLEQGIPNHPGQFGLDAGTIRTETRIRRAVQLLGSAPLAPQVRRALFEWLARQEHAELDTDATDELGRRGTRVTFETVYDEAIAARTVTLEELLDEAELQYGRRPVRAVGAPTHEVPAHRAQRRWYVSFVFDTRTGELLEQMQYTGFRATASRPVLQAGRNRGGESAFRVPWSVRTHRPYGVSTDAQLYMVRERSPAIEPDAAVCVEHPDICR